MRFDPKQIIKFGLVIVAVCAAAIIIGTVINAPELVYPIVTLVLPVGLYQLCKGTASHFRREHKPEVTKLTQLFGHLIGISMFVVGFWTFIQADDGMRFAGMSLFSFAVALTFAGIGISAGLIVGVKKYGKKAATEEESEEDNTSCT